MMDQINELDALARDLIRLKQSAAELETRLITFMNTGGYRAVRAVSGHPPVQVMSPTTLDRVLNDVREEILRARAKHAPMHSAHEGASVIREEFEELWDHVRADTGTTPAARKEAIQVATMALRYVLDLIEKSPI
jgi:hypothetical protein